ncbi:MAG: hypothetical protein WBQ43_00175 [Terriglobales bacterium]
MNRKAYLSILLAVIFMAFAFLTGCSSSTATPPATGTTYVFYLTGLENINEGPNFYTAAGAVTLDAAGDVTGGEEDYNDGFGLTDAPTPIAAATGALAVDPTTGQGTLTLTVGDTNLGVGGVETLGVQFVNTNHALIIQFDGSATSSGSLDLQTATEASGNFAFTYSGVNVDYDPSASGGVVTVASGLINGVYDFNDADLGVEYDQTLTQGTVSTVDAFGRGTISGTQLAGSLAYYVVGPEVVRFICDDTDAALIGSAYGQGSSTFTAANIGSSVFDIQANAWGEFQTTVGSFTTDGVSVVTGGIADSAEGGDDFIGESISGTYTVSNDAVNGYSNLIITSENLGDVSNLGVYMTDPALNLLDPNNTTTGLGGALVLDLDTPLPGSTGVLMPQTDTTSTDFTGNYAFGGQLFNGDDFWEVDFVGQGSVATGVLAGTGIVSDIGGFYSSSPTDTAVGFAATPLADENESTTGRYTIFDENESGPLVITIGESEFGADTVLYQASGGYLFWMQEDDFANFLGPVEQQGSLTGLPAVRKAMAKSPQAKKR